MEIIYIFIKGMNHFSNKEILNNMGLNNPTPISNSEFPD